MKMIRSLLILTLSVLPFLNSIAASEDAPLRSAFIFQFTNYIEWPNVSDQFLIDVIDDSSLFESLKSNTKGKKVGNSEISIRLIQPEDFNQHQFNKTQIVVLPKGTSKEIKNQIETLKKQPVVSISFGEGLASEGSIINFIMVDKNLRFEINQKAAESKKIKISSQLLRLGKSI